MSDDDSPRSPIASAHRSRGSLQSSKADDELFRELAQTVQFATKTSPELYRDVDDLYRGDLGRRIFLSWSRALHGFACRPDAEDKDIQGRLLSALTGAEGGAAVIAGVLVYSFAASPAIAAIVGALLVRIVVAPAADELCKTWAESLKIAEDKGASS